MKISPSMLKWGMRLYPPFLLQRIWVKKIYPNFRGIEVKVNRSLLTTNLGRSTFGGTLFSATDPFYALLCYQIAIRNHIKPIVWLKSARISYIKPARTDLFFTLRIGDELIDEMFRELAEKGKFTKELPIEVYDRKGELCVIAFNEIYIRDQKFQK